MIGIVSTASASEHKYANATEFLNNISNLENNTVITINSSEANVSTSYKIYASNITIKAVNGQVIFQNNASKNRFTIEGANVTLQGITFKNFRGTDSGGAIYWSGENGTIRECNFTNNTLIGSYYHLGGAIYWGSENGNIENCIFTNNTGDFGGAIYWFKGKGNIVNCTFTNNNGYEGGAINWQDGIGNIINCTFTNNNVSADGGAICWVTTEIGDIVNCTFTNNTASSKGGAICRAHSGTGSIIKCTFTNNTAKYGGAIDWTSNGTGDIVNCIFTNNIAYYGGSAINWCNNGTGTITNCTFNKNKVQNNFGGAIRWIDTGVGHIINCNFEDNTANGTGAAITWLDGIGNIENCTFTNNTAKYEGGAIYWSSESGKIVNCNFTNNKDENCADIYNTGNLTIIGGNGALIYNIGKITNTLTVIILGNKTVEVAKDKDVELTAFIKVGNHTVISFKNKEAISFNFTIGTVEIPANLTGDHYTAIYHVIGDVGDEIPVNGSYGYSGAVSYQTAILIVKTGISLTGSNVYKEFENATQYHAVLKNINGNPLSNKIISIAISSAKWSKSAYYWIVTDKDGIATLDINLSPNEYVITALFGDEIAINNITVIPSNLNLKADSFTKYFKNGTMYTVKVTDKNNNPVTNRTVTITIYKSTWKNPAKYNAKTNADGIATLDINLIAGTYSVTANICYNSTKSTITVLPTLTASSITKKVNKAGSLKAKLVDGQGKPAAGKTITLTVKDTTYTLTTDSNGVATLPIHLGLGTWSFLIANPDTGANTRATVKVIR